MSKFIEITQFATVGETRISAWNKSISCYGFNSTNGRIGIIQPSGVTIYKAGIGLYHYNGVIGIAIAASADASVRYLFWQGSDSPPYPNDPIGSSDGANMQYSTNLSAYYFTQYNVAIATVEGLTSDDAYPSFQDLLRAIIITQYPITYHYENATVSGPLEAAVGDTVTVSAVPDVGYGITDASAQILVTNNDIAVPYTWDAANQRITFTMPDPS